MPETEPRGTRKELIDAGLHLFGRQGFGSTSIRQIAARAGANVAAIAYHFGGKAGLRDACGQEASRRIAAVLPDGPVGIASSAQAATLQLSIILRRLVLFLATGRQAADMAAFLLREIAEDGPTLDAIYARTVAPRHRAICALWGQATGRDPEGEAVRLAVFAMMGQALYFRIGRPVVLRRMGWDDIDEDAAGRIADVLCANLIATIERERQP